MQSLRTLIENRILGEQKENMSWEKQNKYFKNVKKEFSQLSPLAFSSRIQKSDSSITLERFSEILPFPHFPFRIF